MKDILTESELNFLRNAGAWPRRRADVRGYPQWLWFQEIKEKEKPSRSAASAERPAIGSGPPKAIAFSATQKFWLSPGGSISNSTCTLPAHYRPASSRSGVCKDLGQRIRQICTERHGDARDWEILYAVEIERAGDLEDRVLGRLGQYSIYSTYWKDGILQQWIELRKCSISQAMEAMAAVLEGKEYYTAINWRDKSAYEFK